MGQYAVLGMPFYAYTEPKMHTTPKKAYTAATPKPLHATKNVWPITKLHIQ